jgi:hypothetical protein
MTYSYNTVVDVFTCTFHLLNHRIVEAAAYSNNHWPRSIVSRAEVFIGIFWSLGGSREEKREGFDALFHRKDDVYDFEFDQNFEL